MWTLRSSNLQNLNRPAQNHVGFVFTQISVGSNDHLGLPVCSVLQVQRPHTFLLKLRLLLVEQFTPEHDR